MTTRSPRLAQLATFASALVLPALFAPSRVAAQAETPRALLWTETASPSEAVTAWESAERSRGAAWTSSTFVTPNPAPLTALPELGGAVLLGFDVPGHGAVAARFERYERTLDHQVFRGSVAGGRPEDVVLLCVGPSGAMAGAFYLGDATYSLHASGLGTTHVLRAVDGARLPGCGTTAQHHVHGHGHGGAAVSTGGPGGAGGGGGGGGGPATAASSTETVLDVLTVYTARARSTGGGTAAIEAELVLRVANATLASELSGAPIRFRLVHLVETSYSEDGSTSDLSRFRSTSDGIMDEVHQLRADYGADLMHLITQPASLQYCGVAYLMRTNSTSFAPNAFGVTVRSCLGGETMSHELGHNISCHHDRNNASGSLFAYGYGYRTPDDRYRTIMSYRPGTRVNRWSSPNVQFNGYTMGTAANEDNARAISNTRINVSRFRPATVYDWCPIEGGVAGSFGEPEITGRGRSTGSDPIQLQLLRTRPGAPGALIIGSARLDQSLLGATLVPSPLLAIPLTGTFGALTLDVSVLRTLPAGNDLYIQAFFADPTGPLGIAASDALQTMTL